MASRRRRGHQIMQWLVHLIYLLPCCCLAPGSATKTRSELVAYLQTCITPKHLLLNVGRLVTPSNDVDGSLSSLVLLRLSKQVISLSNSGKYTENEIFEQLGVSTANKILSGLCSCLDCGAKGSDVNAVVEGLKSSCVLFRLLPASHSGDCWDSLMEFWRDDDRSEALLSKSMEPHHLTGIKWALDTFDREIPQWVEASLGNLNIPFEIVPRALGPLPELSVASLTSQAVFQVDDIRTTSDRIVKERRQTAWEGDKGVAPFAYSGKEMPRHNWSPVVKKTRDLLAERFDQYYDGCLLNHYPDGGSGMRYHIDPDQGNLWDYETAVVSVGASRRFGFREIPGHGASPPSKPHTFVVMDGDVTFMFGDCQERFQHTVKKADNKKETASRASLVFKRTLGFGK